MQKYIDLLIKWNQKINLVGKSTIDDIHERHVRDSLQLLKFIDPNDKVIDLGSGAGFPGMVIALNGIQNVTLIEADSRKAAFLLQASLLAPRKVNIINERVENLSMECDILTARAFASINNILKLSSKMKIAKKMLLLKGKRVEAEIAEAQKHWSFEYILHPSETQEGGWIVELRRIP